MKLDLCRTLAMSRVIVAMVLGCLKIIFHGCLAEAIDLPEGILRGPNHRPVGRSVEVVVPGHVDHDHPFGLAAALNFCLFRHRAPFHPVVSGLNFGPMVKAVVWKNQRRWAERGNQRQEFCGLYQQPLKKVGSAENFWRVD
jgi:hypothetical protein